MCQVYCCQDLSESIIVSREEKSVLPAGVPPITRSNPEIITGTAVVKNDDELKPEKPLPEAHIELPAFAVKHESARLAAPLTDDEDDEDRLEQDESEDQEEDEEEEERL